MAFSFLGPYEVKKVNRKDRYEVEKLGHFEKSIKTTTSADNMKRWRGHLEYHELDTLLEVETPSDDDNEEE